MSDRADTPIQRDHPTEAQLGAHSGGQLSLSLGPSPAAPPPTRTGCSELARPCPRTACPHNLQRDDEPAGRPGDNMRRDLMPVRVRKRPGAPSCTLDLAEQHPDGMSRKEVGAELEIGGARVRQIETRAAVKQRLAHALLRVLDAFRGRLPEGVELTIEPVRPPSDVRHTLLVAVTLEETAIAQTAQAIGVRVRKGKRPAGPDKEGP